MALNAIEIEGYRSIRKIRFPVDDLTVFVGSNGVGKTNLYRALQLLHAAALGEIGKMIGEEGGLQSILWAGPRQKGSPRLVLRAVFDVFDYVIELGYPSPAEASLRLDASVKSELIRCQTNGRRVVMMERKSSKVWLVDEEGRRHLGLERLLSSETALSAIRDADRYPELSVIRQELAGWRFYHQVRTDADSPLRRPQLSVCTPTLSSDASDLAAVLATVYDVAQDPTMIEEAVQDAFPGGRLIIGGDSKYCDFSMQFPEINRPFEAHELSDGTLSYLCLVGALCGYRLPSFVALNEPEANLHPSLMPALAKLIASAAKRTRVWVVTHSDSLAEELQLRTEIEPRRVIKTEKGETSIDGLSILGAFRDEDEECL